MQYRGLQQLQILTACSVCMLSACTTVIHKSDPHYAPVVPKPSQYEPVNNGAIYQAHTAMPLFEDLKARRVGDVLTVILAEKTNASKSASTSTKKESSNDAGTPTVLGRPVTKGGTNILGTTLESAHEFTGSGDSEQSNSLTGTISVTVAEVHPNGNLFVRGQKSLNLNRGDEYIQISGIVRPIDIGPDNTIVSTLIADARIAYSGRGELADANTMGWLARFFNSVLWPF